MDFASFHPVAELAAVRPAPLFGGQRPDAGVRHHGDHHLAHGSFYMVGAYLAFVLSSATGNLFMAILLGVPLALIFGAFLEWALFSHLYKRDHLEQVLLTCGLILVFQEVRSLLVGDEVHGVDIPALFSASIPLSGVLSYPVYRLVISAVCIVLAVALYFVIQRTRLGMMIRAGNHDRTMVEALGVNINMIYRVVFALGVALTACGWCCWQPVMGGVIVAAVLFLAGGLAAIPDRIKRSLQGEGSND